MPRAKPTMIESLPHERDHRLLLLITATAVFTLLVLGIVSWDFYRDRREASELLPVALHTQELEQRILYLDEVLTMSARMSAQTGDPRWEQRYRQFDPQLGDALKEAMLLSPEIASTDAVTHVELAIAALVTMENLAFDLVRAGSLAEAQALLSSANYEAQKRIYYSGMSEYGRALAEKIQGAEANLTTDFRVDMTLTIVAVIFLLLGWGYVLRTARGWQVALVDSNLKLNHTKVEFESLAGQLEQKVNERTRQLKESELASLNMMEDAVRSQQRVQLAYETQQRDMAERRALEEQIQQSQRMDSIGQLTGGVAHDFNNLLTVILGNSELLAEQLGAQPRLFELAEMIQAAAQRGADLTHRLLAFSRRQALEPSLLDGNKLLAGMEGLLRRTLSADIDIQIVSHPDLWATRADPSQLENAVLNLCLNARDSMDDGGRLVVETANIVLDQEYARHNPGVKPGPYMLIAVTDTGVGIAPENLKRVFEPFFTTKEFGKGTGLGLSMVYGFAKQSGGHVSIYSELNKGTTVRLYLPAIDAPIDAAASAAESAAAVGGSENILLVEDDQFVRDYGDRLLSSLGYQVVSAANGAEAMAILRQNPDIDLLFTDMVMPGGMTGSELAQAANKLRPALKVLFTSGYTDMAISNQGVLPERVHLLSKPYRRQDLAAKVRAVLAERPIRTSANE
jgi:signal transduction histidine kinase/ActR/RegA family two-component response regulator